MGIFAKFGGALAKGLSKTSGTVGGIVNIWPPGAEEHSQKAFSVQPNRILSLHEAIIAHRMEAIPHNLAIDYARKNGFDADIFEYLRKATITLLSAADYVSLARRNPQFETKARDRLAQLGYEPDVISELWKATEYLPGPQDIIRFAVRDVYSPNIRSKNPEADKPPTAFIEEAKKVGLLEEHAKAYWYAHWELPSVNQAFEMRHRDVINDEQLRSLLQAKDVMPDWVKPLLDISYNPLTRVDVRRMFRVKVLDREGVKRAYKDIGYNEDNAELLTQFTERFEKHEGAGLTRGSIINAYLDDIIDANQALQYMLVIDISPEVAAIYIAQAEVKKAQKELKELESELTARFRAGSISLTEVQNQLAAVEAPATFINAVVGRLTKAESQRLKQPSRADFDRWFERGIISESYYFESLIKLGYSAEHVRFFMTEAIDAEGEHKRKFLGVATYQKWLKAGIMDENAFRTTLKAMHISDGDIQSAIIQAGQQNG